MTATDCLDQARHLSRLAAAATCGERSIHLMQQAAALRRKAAIIMRGGPVDRPAAPWNR